MRSAMKLLLIAAVLPLIAAAAWTSAAAEAALVPIAMHGGFHPPNTLPDPTPLHVCRVLKRYGGGQCTSPPYAPIGRHCSCEGPRGPRPGTVTWR